MTTMDGVADDAVERGTSKGYRQGTDRLVAPTETLERVRPHFARMGITRVANVTGLDIIGVPVVMASRPNSRSVNVSQGKGLALDAAKASAVMEASEGYHAEHIRKPLVAGTYQEIQDSRSVIDIFQLPLDDRRTVRDDRTMLWIEGRELVRDEPIWVPYDIVHTDFRTTSPYGKGTFVCSANGLASGNHLLEAVSHATCELIERDGSRLWTMLSREARRETCLDLDTVDDVDCREVLDKLAAAKTAVRVWETTTDVGLPSFRCVIAEDPDHAVLPLYPAAGFGCHLRREIALLRALTEAVQSRLTLISGMREDTGRTEYERLRSRRNLDLVWAGLTQPLPGRDFRAVPTYSYGSFEQDIALENEKLRSVGIEQVVVVDLSKPEIGLPVVRVVIPGLLGPEGAPGRRAESFLGRHR
ncbi:YcaO-like family protein [Wenjunlia tyrosinilytica]|uniref:YcaO domain-containing protein n=1 Tax=Wenjunlia tyrosinilytica TaxID=1544741 RepID=A0A918E2N2_9ACTN|nr:YcaO-like family protein [Wenjunlia tyrosinilytica]GGP00024.1 hypothetical protein GCM10012280_67820 [Wenjunlia tyrosinilytica]